MKLHYFSIIFSFILILFGCNIDKLEYNDDAELAYEIQVLNEIFVDLTKEVGVSYGYPIHPPPSRSILDAKGKIIGYDTTKYLRQLEKYRIDTAKFSINEGGILLAFYDTLSQIKNESVPFRNHLPSDEYIAVFNDSRPINKPNRKIILDSISNTGFYELKYRSELKSDINEFYAELYKKGGEGALGCSRIHFDKNKKFGIFMCGYYRGILNAHGGCVYIRKINGKWQVEQYSVGWIS